MDLEGTREEVSGCMPGGTPYSGWLTIGLGLLVGTAFTLIQIAVMVLFVAANFISSTGLGSEEYIEGAATNGLIVAVSTCATSVLCTGLVVFLASSRRGITVKDYLALRYVSVRSLAVWTAGVLALILLSDWMTRVVGRSVVPEVMLDMYRTAGFYPLFWLAVVVAAPISEEIFFRGFLFAGFQHSRIGPFGAILLTSLVWTLIHIQYDVWGLGLIFLLGVFLGLVRLRTASVYATIALHALVNLVATIETVAALSQETSFFAG